MVLTAYFVLSPVTGLSCHRHRREIPPTWHQRRGVRTTRLRRPRPSTPKASPGLSPSPPKLQRRRISIIRPARVRAPDAAASTASRRLRPWRSRNAPLCGWS